MLIGGLTLKKIKTYILLKHIIVYGLSFITVIKLASLSVIVEYLSLNLKEG